MSGRLTQEQYLQHFEKYLENKKIQLKNPESKCFLCQSGHLELTESEKTIILNCHEKSCDNWKLQLPVYHNFDEKIQEIENHPKMSSEKKKKEIKKLTDIYDSMNYIDKNFIESSLSDYNFKKHQLNELYNRYRKNEITLQVFSQECASLNKDLIRIKKYLSENVHCKRINKVFVPDTIKPRLLKI